MTSKQALADQYFKDGYNCAQAVALAFAEDLGYDLDAMARLSSSFGGGIGRMRQVCGALSGAALVLGIAFGYDSPTDLNAKTEHYDLIQTVCRAFEAKMGSALCAELLGEGPDGSPIPTKRTKEFFEVRPCAGAVQTAAGLVEDCLAQR